MWCGQQFAAFSELLKLDGKRRARIDSSITTFTTFCQEDAQLKAKAVGPPFLQGSVATNTAIRPLAGDEFDVDVVYPFDLGKFPNGTTPTQVIQWFMLRLQQNSFYKSRLTPKDRCARINYAGDFHVDVIPSTPSLHDYQPYAVPARDVASWIKNDPVGFANWLLTRDKRGGGFDSDGCGYLVRSIRIMKRWRDGFFSSQAAPSSMLLATFLGNHDPSGGPYTPPIDNPLFPTHQHQAAFLYDLLRLTRSCLVGAGARSKPFENPVIPGEDLGREWQATHLEGFLARLATCIQHLGEGIGATTPETATKQYKLALGDTFPGI